MTTSTVTRLVPADDCPGSIVRHWVAEDFAVAIGLLRECPYHGRPYRVEQSANTSAAAACLSDVRLALDAFEGDRNELLVAAQRVARDYSFTCSECDAEHAQLEFFD